MGPNLFLILLRSIALVDFQSAARKYIRSRIFAPLINGCRRSRVSAFEPKTKRMGLRCAGLSLIGVVCSLMGEPEDIHSPLHWPNAGDQFSFVNLCNDRNHKQQ